MKVSTTVQYRMHSSCLILLTNNNFQLLFSLILQVTNPTFFNFRMVNYYEFVLSHWRMPHSFGYRAATRTLFKKPYKTNGRCKTTTYLRNFKVLFSWLPILCWNIFTDTDSFSAETMLILKLTHPFTKVIDELFVKFGCDLSNLKGMPFKHYQGRTGVVFNVTKRAIGVVVNKEVWFVKVLLLYILPFLINRLTEE